MLTYISLSLAFLVIQLVIISLSSHGSADELNKTTKELNNSIEGKS